MDIHVSLRHGPLEVEIDADSEDDYQSELLDLLEFLEEYEERFTDLDPQSGELESEVDDGNGVKNGDDDHDGQASMDVFTGGNDASEEEQATPGKSSTTANEEAEIASLAKKADASVKQLRDFVDIDSTGEEPPFIVAETDNFGENKTRRQFIGSLILLAVWDKCYEEDRMKSSTLKDALEFSNIDSDSMYNMYNLDDAEGLFDKTGRGGRATVKLTRPGQREAYKKLRNLLELE